MSEHRQSLIHLVQAYGGFSLLKITNEAEAKPRAESELLLRKPGGASAFFHE